MRRRRIRNNAQEQWLRENPELDDEGEPVQPRDEQGRFAGAGLDQGQRNEHSTADRRSAKQRMSDAIRGAAGFGDAA